MSNDFYSGIYNPDVLSCLANLSNDEVFTPPEVANSMLDIRCWVFHGKYNTIFCSSTGNIEFCSRFIGSNYFLFL